MSGETVAFVIIFILIIGLGIGAIFWYNKDRKDKNTPSPNTPSPNTPSPNTSSPQSNSGTFFTISSLNGNYLSSNLPYAATIKEGTINEYYLGSLGATGTVTSDQNNTNRLLINLSGSVTGTNLSATYTGTDQSLIIQFGSGEKWLKVPANIKSLDGTYTSSDANNSYVYTISNGVGTRSDNGVSISGFIIQPNTDTDSSGKPFLFVFSPTSTIKAYLGTTNGQTTLIFDNGAIWALSS